VHDALAMYERGRYASSMVLSVFAREKVGRFVILVELRKEALASGTVFSAEDVTNACDEEMSKRGVEPRFNTIESRLGTLSLGEGDAELRCQFVGALHIAGRPDCREKVPRVLQVRGHRTPFRARVRQRREIEVGAGDVVTSVYRRERLACALKMALGLRERAAGLSRPTERALDEPDAVRGVRVAQDPEPLVR